MLPLAALLTAAALAGSCAARTAPRATVYTPPGDLAALLSQLHAADPRVRLRAAFFLAATHRSSPGVAEALRAVLEDPSADVREVAFWGLQRPANDAAQAASAREYDQPPRARTLVKPVYPDDAFRKRVEGVVEVELLIGRDGRVVYAWVMRGIEGLELAALHTVAQWTFEPARRGGQPVPTVARAPVTFRIY
jgi:TonB family protein